MAHLPVLFQHTGFEPLPNQPQKRPIVNAPLEDLHQLVVVDHVEETLDVYVHDVAIATEL
jgi:hypothetical protein